MRWCLVLSSLLGFRVVRFILSTEETDNYFIRYGTISCIDKFRQPYPFFSSLRSLMSLVKHNPPKIIQYFFLSLGARKPTFYHFLRCILLFNRGCIFYLPKYIWKHPLISLIPSPVLNVLMSFFVLLLC